MRFSPLALAALLPLLASVSAQSQPPPPVCADASTVNKAWWPELNLPVSEANDIIFSAGLTTKLSDHTYEFSAVVSNNKGDKKASIMIYNGHGKDILFRINFKRANGSIVHSFVSMSNNGGCVSTIVVDPAEVKLATIEMVKK